MATASVCVPRVSSSCLLHLQEALQVGVSDPASFQITASFLSPRACEILCAVLSVVSLFPTAIWLSWK